MKSKNPFWRVRQIHRKPTPAEIKFGHGCTIYSEAMVPDGKKFVTRNGLRWTISR